MCNSFWVKVAQRMKYLKDNNQCFRFRQVPESITWSSQVAKQVTACETANNISMELDTFKVNFPYRSSKIRVCPLKLAVLWIEMIFGWTLLVQVNIFVVVFYSYMWQRRQDFHFCCRLKLFLGQNFWNFAGHMSICFYVDCHAHLTKWAVANNSIWDVVVVNFKTRHVSELRFGCVCISKHALVKRELDGVTHW